MFQEICNFKDVIRAIALERILFENVQGYSGDFIDGDFFYQESTEIVFALAQYAYYLEYTDSTLHFFKFEEMDEFYTLCKEHSRRNHINFRKNPYVKAAKEYVLDTIRCSGMQNIAWNYWIPRKLINGRQHRFLIETGCYFYEWLEMIQTLFTIKAYFKEKVETLEAELYPIKRVIAMPTPITVATEERKAA